MGVRLNLARALLADPELLFLDEPTSGLDPARVAQVEAIIDRQRRRGCSVVVTTHDMVLAERACDRVGFIVDGGRGLFLLPQCDVPAVDVPKNLKREREPLLPNLSENEISRHYTRLAERTHGINNGFYPLGIY